jgi:diacylglycerol kinase (ATP)
MKPFSIRKRFRSFVYAFRGLKIMLINEHNAWIHSIVAIIVIVLGFVYQVSLTEWCLLVFSMGLVLTAEALNSSVEELTDLVSPGINEKAGRAKDIGAGAVLIASITAAIIGLIIFIPKLF